jgi:hypothetical protein
MTDDRDPVLQALFAEAQQTLGDDAFTTGVMLQVKTRRQRFYYWSALILLTVAICWVLAPALQEFSLLTAQALTSNLFDPGDGWLSFLVAPVNNVASLLIVAIKIVRSGRKRLLGASFA